MLGRLPAINEMMPAFSGTDAERTAVAAYLATLGSARARTEGLR
jgi:mono/diheme cytochrome c family protein